jgi:predicted dehydrogenase
MNRLKVCLVGFGYWGPNLARHLSTLETFDLRYIVELDEAKHYQIKTFYPNAKIFSSIEDLSEFRDFIDVAVIATPAATHFNLARLFLEFGCHVWIEKPLALSHADAEEIVTLSMQLNLKVFVDHTFLYTTAIRAIKTDILKILPITYINSTRANFGIIQEDSSVVWDLAVHDLAILTYLTDLKAVSVLAKSSSPAPNLQPCVSTIIVDYGQFLATVHVNWLSPFKIRDFFVGGTNGSIYYDDTETEDKVRIYSQSIKKLISFDQSNIRKFDYKYGEVTIPDIGNEEALASAFRAFSDYILADIEPPSSGSKALQVIRILEAIGMSISQNGASIGLDLVL